LEILWHHGGLKKQQRGWGDCDSKFRQNLQNFRLCAKVSQDKNAKPQNKNRKPSKTKQKTTSRQNAKLKRKSPKHKNQNAKPQNHKTTKTQQ